MLFPTLVLTAPTAALAQHGWVEVGPERGHVVDAAVGPRQVCVATRVGVLSSTPGLEKWHRDSRFPPEVRRLALGLDGTCWAAPAGHLWRVGETSEHVAAFEDSIAVDVAVAPSGAAFAAVRGRHAAVYRYAAGRADEVLADIDPWCLAVDGEQVLVGTVDGGAWLSSDDGLTFTALGPTRSVSAVGFWQGQPWLGLPDGTILAGVDLAPAGTVAPGHAIGFAPLADGVLIAVEGASSGDALYLANRSTLRIQPLARVDDDASTLDLTGVWPLPTGALVGSFRRGPLTWRDGALRPARDGFRATITGGAVLDGQQRLLLALMGTGVYLSTDGLKSWTPQHGRSGPVTDAVSVVDLGPGLLVLDFEGLAYLDGAGTWSRLAGIPGQTGQSGLADVSLDTASQWWGVDRQGGLWLSQRGTWQRCATRGALRLDGLGEDLLLASLGGYRQPASCDTPWPLYELEGADATLKVMESQAIKGWVAAPGHLWRHGKLVAELPMEGISALASDGDGALVALQDGTILACDPTCQAAALPLHMPAIAIGRLADGRLWAAESTGTLLVSGDGPAPPPWTGLQEGKTRRTDLVSLERPPWSQEGQAASGAPPPALPPSPPLAPQQRPAPQVVVPPPTTPPALPPAPRRWPLILLVLAPLAVLAAWLLRLRRKTRA